MVRKLLTKKELKEHRTIVNRKYYNKNKAKLNKDRMDYHKANRDKCNATQRKSNRKTGYSKRWYHRNKEKCIRNAYKWQKKQRAENPEFKRRSLLRAMTYHHNRDISDRKCTTCASNKDLQRHHPSYESVDFIILCRRCHTDLHMEIRDKERETLMFDNKDETREDN